MTPDAMLVPITRFFTDQLHVPAPAVDADLFELGALDSLSFVELLLHLEQQFAIRIPGEDLEMDQFRTIRGIARFVAGQREGRGAAVS
jgi:acyl carrier protein